MLTVAPPKPSAALAEQIDAFLALFFGRYADPTYDVRRTGPMAWVLNAHEASAQALASLRLGINAALFGADDGAVTIKPALQGDWMPQDAFDLDADDPGLGERDHVELAEPEKVDAAHAAALSLSDPDTPLEIEPSFDPPSVSGNALRDGEGEPDAAHVDDPVAVFRAAVEQIACGLEGRLDAAADRLDAVGDRLEANTGRIETQMLQALARWGDEADLRITQAVHAAVVEALTSRSAA